MKKTLASLVTLAALGSISAQAQSALKNLDDPNSGYELVFLDHFNYANRAALEASGKWHLSERYEWNPADPTSGSFLYRKDDVDVVQDGNDSIRVLRLKFTDHSTPLTGYNIPGWNPNTYPGANVSYTRSSGVVEMNYNATTKRPSSIPPLETDYYNGYDQEHPIYCDNTIRFGIIHIRARVAQGEGMQSAFWLHAGAGSCSSGNCDRDPQFTTGDWEIDGFETFGSWSQNVGPFNRRFFSTIQPNTYNGMRGPATYHEWGTDDPGNGFHTYTIAWTPTEVTWFRDGIAYRTDDNTRGIPNMAMGMILSAHYKWGDCSTGPCPTNRAFDIDWIRVYKAKSTSMQAGNIAWPSYKDAPVWTKTALLNIASTTTPGTTRVTMTGGGYRPVKLYFVNASNTLCYATPGSTPGSWSVVTTGCNNVKPGSDIVAVPETEHVFYVGNDNNVWNYSNYNGGSFGPANLNPTSSYAANADGKLAYDYQNSRIYYTTTNNTAPFYHELFYYEFSNNTWSQHNSYVNHVEGPLKVLNGGLLYRGRDDNNIWQYSNDGQGYWSAVALSTPYGTSDDAKRLLETVETYGVTNGPRIYYETNSGELKYYEYVSYVKDYVGTSYYNCASNKWSSCTTCPNWVRNTSNVNSLSSAYNIMTNFNNQLLYINGSNSVDEYRRFKVYNGKNQFLTDLAVTYLPSGNSAVALFGVDNENTYFLEFNGNISRIKCTEKLNPTPNYNPSNIAYSFRPGTMATATATTQATAARALQVYPNPATSNIRFASATKKIASVTVISTIGKTAIAKPVDAASTDVSLEHLPTGIYIYRVVMQDGTVETGKFQKQ